MPAEKINESFNAEEFIKVARIVNILRNLDFDKTQFNTQIDSTGVHVQIRSQKVSEGLDLSKFQFGCTIIGAVATVLTGEIRWGTHAPIIVGDTNFTITQDNQYVGIEFDGTTPTMLGPSTNEANFQSDDTHYRTWFYKFQLSGGKASVYKIGKIGNIEIPVFYGN